MSLIDSIAQAIYQMEGSGPTTIATRNNNPGNLRSGPGMIGTNGGFAVFPDMATGFSALNNQIQLNIDRGLTLNEFFGGKPGVYAGYAPSTDSNDPSGYAAFVAQQIGVDPNTPILMYSIDTQSFTLLPDVSSNDVSTTDYTSIVLLAGLVIVGIVVAINI